MFRRTGKSTRSVLTNFRVTPEERDRLQGLAYYLEMSVADLIILLEREKRQQLYDEGKRPPLRRPTPETEGPKTPRRGTT